MEFFFSAFLAWCLFFVVDVTAAISPGPAFAMNVRNTMKYGRRAGIFTALGQGAGVGFHVMLVLCGLAVIVAKSAFVFSMVKYAGAAYLVYIGIKALRHAKPFEADALPEASPRARLSISPLKAFQMGLWTNILNPKAVVFFTAIFTQFIPPDASVEMMAVYGVTSVIVEAGWFSLLAVFLTHEKINGAVRATGAWIERVCGGLMVGLGIKLALSKI